MTNIVAFCYNNNHSRICKNNCQQLNIDILCEILTRRTIAAIPKIGEIAVKEDTKIVYSWWN